MLAADKVHRTSETNAYEKRVEIGSVVSDNDIVFGQVLFNLVYILEFQLKKKSYGREKALIETHVSFDHSVEKPGTFRIVYTVNKCINV